LLVQAARRQASTLRAASWAVSVTKKLPIRIMELMA
jgi:hypothetical protein